VICQECKDVAATNRWVINLGRGSQVKHPKDCNCMCGHKKAKEWDAQFSTEEPK